MSHVGKLWRGIKWDRHRDSNGRLEQGVALDENKMQDVEYWLEFSKGRDKDRMKQIVIEIMHYSKEAPSIKVQQKLKKLQEELNTPVKETKPVKEKSKKSE